MRKHHILTRPDRERVIKAAGIRLSQTTLKNALTCVATGGSSRQLSPSPAIALHRAAESLGMPIPRVWHLRTDWREVWPNLDKPEQ